MKSALYLEQSKVIKGSLCSFGSVEMVEIIKEAVNLKWEVDEDVTLN